ncbi:hypothetical protein [Nocardiopsis synnemataformans]|uniref:hypothetical protein n=1 Tax=Nocardiopsis synnemataformans TaxID=61305 RepID=UPI003EB94B8E
MPRYLKSSALREVQARAAEQVHGHRPSRPRRAARVRTLVSRSSRVQHRTRPPGRPVRHHRRASAPALVAPQQSRLDAPSRELLEATLAGLRRLGAN